MKKVYLEFSEAEAFRLQDALGKTLEKMPRNAKGRSAVYKAWIQVAVELTHRAGMRI